MSHPNQNITLELLLNSFHDEFDPVERDRIFQNLKTITITDDKLLGAKLLLDDNNWDYVKVNSILIKAENRINTIALKNKSIHTKNIKRNYLKYAVIIIPFMAWIGNYILNNHKAIDDFYIKETGLPNLMSTSSINEWNRLMNLYKTGSLEEAFEYSTELKDKYVQNDTAIYFNAVIAYDIEKYNIATKAFQILDAKTESTFLYDAEYRLGLSLYKLGKKQESKIQFNKIKLNIDSPYNSEAKLILQQLF